MMTDSARILVVDNYDSFVYTIVGYVKTLGATVTVVRNDAIDPSTPGVIDDYDGVLISPGPGAPSESGQRNIFELTRARRRTSRCSACASACRHWPKCSVPQ